MKLLATKVLRGPNYWSSYRKKLIELKIDLEKYEHLPSNLLVNFTSRLKNTLPSLASHYCSPGVVGGFFLRLEEGTWMGHVIEHVALELQSLAGMDCGFGRTFSTPQEGVYHVIFSYQIEKAGLCAAEAAIRLVKTLAENKPYENLEKDIQTIVQIRRKYSLGPSTQALVDEAQLRKIPVFVNESSSLITLGYGVNQKKLWASVSSETSSIAVDIAADKELTKEILAKNYLPVPEGGIVSSLEELHTVSKQLGFPLVVKPFNGNHGRGVTTNIQNKKKLIRGYHFAQQISDEIIIERYIEGDDYRFLVVNYKVAAVAKRIPAHIIGTGSHSIRELIDAVNRDPKRGEAHENILTTIKIDTTTQNILEASNLSLDDILPKDKILVLKDTANLSSGGTAIDVTKLVHPKNLFLAERAARLIGLDICGIDIIAKNISIPITKYNGAILEVNAGPGLRMHLHPCEGHSREVAKPVIEMLFPQNAKGTIPIVAVTGTNGKTTVVRLIANLMKKAGSYVGYTTTEGVYLNNELIYEGDCSGPLSAQIPLQDPKVDFAVLECARGGILRAGLGFDECDISIITNITNDHLGLNDINTLDELAKVKGVLAHSTKKQGYSLLNAENDLTYALKDELCCNIALFSREKSQRIENHCNSGGLACYIENSMLIIQQGSWVYKIVHIQEIPATLNGLLTSMLQNILPVCLVGFIQGLSIEFLKQFFISFRATPQTIPGRMNRFEFPNSTVILDYGHNEEAYKELGNYLKKLHHKKKIGIIGVAGDRREEDIKKIGSIAAELFDEIIIRHDNDGRGRTNSQLTDWLNEGILKVNKKPSINIISNELEAIDYALKQIKDPSVIYFSVENVFKTIQYLQKHQQLIKEQMLL